jgi:signal peptidase I
VAAAVIVAYFMQAFVAKPFEIPSGSMESTLMPGDRVLVNRLAYKYGSIQRGDIIVFRSPDDPKVDFIKRVIAIGGDTIEVRQGQVLVNKEPQVEDYVHVNDVSNFRYNVVPPGKLFVMGDNRTDSQDSRYWKVPWLDEESVIGKAFMIYWPPSRIGRLN